MSRMDGKKTHTHITTTDGVVNILLCFLHRLELTIRRLISLKSENIFFLPPVFVCVVIPFILDARFLWTYHPGVIQEEGHTGFLHIIPSAMLALIFVARRTQPFQILSLVDHESNLCLLLI